ncbi:DUF6199 family natural product biosynthesis protein [Clostridium paridis]|uniref:Histidine kinase n=1 Tax=Clostridium paridis TaxID=2803863 RepID=A0A937FJP6_9CLOT|nr:DUF6199 family natural product biosynthesis protein [Clostridium paridis]MBL4933622.1 histidine kinase [Clostridium paridis]
MIFIKVIVSIILIIGIINPRLSWKISEGWKFKGVEPSTLYLIMTRVMSVVMLIVVWLAIPN